MGDQGNPDVVSVCLPLGWPGQPGVRAREPRRRSPEDFRLPNFVRGILGDHLWRSAARIIKLSGPPNAAEVATEPSIPRHVSNRLLHP
jgi:hypothetical protein